MATSNSANRGILYFAKGDEFVKEATISAHRVKSVMPECPIALVADQKPSADCFDDVILDETPFLKQDKARAMQRTPYERTLYLDTDIYLEESVSEMFEIIDKFDVAIRQDGDLIHIPGDENEIVDGVPPGVPEFNAGVILYRDSKSVMDMLEDWESRCLPEHEWDQRSLRPALYHSDVRICPLEHRYNCMYRYDNTVSGSVKVFHGPLLDRERNRVDLDVARDRLNRSTEFRIHRRYMNTVLVDPPIAFTTRLRTQIDHFKEVLREDGIRPTLFRTVRFMLNSIDRA